MRQKFSTHSLILWKWICTDICISNISISALNPDGHTSRKNRDMSRDVSKPTKWRCAQRRLRSAWASAYLIRVVLCANWVAKDPRFLHADSEDSDQTGRIPRLRLSLRTDLSLRWAHIHFVGFVMSWLIYVFRANAVISLKCRYP